MVGSPDLAAQIAQKESLFKRAPKGWRYVGAGACRRVYLGPDGIVYKIDTDNECYWNRQEIKTARRLRRSRTLWQWDVSVPEITGHRVTDAWENKVVVNAMPYLPSALQCECDSYMGYDGWIPAQCTCRTFGVARPCFGFVQHHLIDDLGLEDMWRGNMSYCNKSIWLIDLGEYS